MSPQITPGYWICPRCDSKDTYFAPRIVGQVGVARPFEIGEFDVAGGVARSVEKDVALCRTCGERAKWINEVRVYSKEEENRFGIYWNWACLIFGTGTTIFTVMMSEFGYGWEGVVLMIIGIGSGISGLVGLIRNSSK